MYGMTHKQSCTCITGYRPCSHHARGDLFTYPRQPSSIFNPVSCLFSIDHFRLVGDLKYRVCLDKFNIRQYMGDIDEAAEEEETGSDD